MAALLHGVSDYAEDAKRSQEQRANGEKRSEQHLKATGIDAVGNNLCHRPKSKNWNSGIDVSNDAAECARERVRISGRANDDGSGFWRAGNQLAVRVRGIDHEQRRRFQIYGSNVAHDANHLAAL